jgi:hypothetical protein
MPVGISGSFGELFQPLPGSDLARDGVKLQPNGKPLPELASMTLLNGESHFHDFRDHHFPIIRQYTDIVTVFSDDNDGPLGLSELFGNIIPRESITGKPYSALGKHGRQLYVEDASEMVPGPKGQPRPLRKYLDLDVLDTSFLQTNVQSMRHTFFGINRQVVDDLFDIVVYHKRAHERTSRLMRRDGNEYAYQTAPDFYTY